MGKGSRSDMPPGANGCADLFASDDMHPLRKKEPVTTA